MELGRLNENARPCGVITYTRLALIDTVVLIRRELCTVKYCSGALDTRSQSLSAALPSGNLLPSPSPLDLLDVRQI